VISTARGITAASQVDFSWQTRARDVRGFLMRVGKLLICNALPRFPELAGQFAIVQTEVRSGFSQ